MLTARRNLLKTLAALATLPLSKLVRASPYEFNRSHAISYEIMSAEIEKMADEVDRALSVSGTGTPYNFSVPPTYVLLSTREDEALCLAYVWEGETPSDKRSITTALRTRDWRTAQTIARILKQRRKVKHVVMTRLIKGRQSFINKNLFVGVK